MAPAVRAFVSNVFVFILVSQSYSFVKLIICVTLYNSGGNSTDGSTNYWCVCRGGIWWLFVSIWWTASSIREKSPTTQLPQTRMSNRYTLLKLTLAFTFMPKICIPGINILIGFNLSKYWLLAKWPN